MTCLICGRKLSSPKSLELGYGPVCYEKISGSSKTGKKAKNQRNPKRGHPIRNNKAPVTIYQGRWSCRIIWRVCKEKESAFATLQQTIIFYHNPIENRSKIWRAIRMDHVKTDGKILVTLTQSQLKDIYEKSAAIGARGTVKAFEQERKKELGKKADIRLRNTKLLLRNYHMLKEHAENSVFGRTQMEESAADILESMMSIYNNEVIIESIKRSATRTAVIVSHIETMFGLYAAYCDKSQNRDIDMRRYEVVWDMYMAEDTLSVKEIAEKQNLSKDSVYADLRVVTERLTALIFGVDGLYAR